MGREHHWHDRAQIKRVRKKIVRGAVEGETPELIGQPIACILVEISGREAPDGARTAMPENAMLHFSKTDTAGTPVAMRQGDTIVMTYMTDGTGVEKPRMFKVVSDIKPNRRGRELVSYSAEVRMENEF